MIHQTPQNKCEICQGRGKIKLPVVRAMAINPDEKPEEMKTCDMIREFDCPNCSEQVAVRRMMAVCVTQAQSVLGMNIDERHRYDNHIQEELAKNIGLRLLASGSIVFEYKTDALLSQRRVQAVVAVAHPDVSADMSKSIAAQAQVLCAEQIEIVTDRIIQEVSNWGSHFGDVHIRKDKVVEIVQTALRHYL